MHFLVSLEIQCGVSASVWLKEVSTLKENCDKASFGFLLVCSVGLKEWSDREMQMREERQS